MMDMCWQALLSINLLKEKNPQIQNTVVFAVSHLGNLEQVTLLESFLNYDSKDVWLMVCYNNLQTLLLPRNKKQLDDNTLVLNTDINCVSVSILLLCIKGIGMCVSETIYCYLFFRITVGDVCGSVSEDLHYNSSLK